MRTLVRFAWRELARARGRFALIALILTVQAAALGGGYLAQESLYRTRDFWSERLHLADLDVHFVPASANEMPPLERLRGIPGVSAVSRRFIALGYVEKASAAPLPVVVNYLDAGVHPPVNDVELLSGVWLERGAPEHAVVDRSFAAAHGLSLGDEIVVNPHRFAARFTVSGVGLSAEHLVPTANPEMLVPHKGSLGVVYASREALDRTFPDELFNDLVFTFEPGVDATRASERVLGELAALEIERVVTKRSTFGHRFIDVMLSGSRSVTPIIALLVGLMAAIVAFISVFRLVAERWREIGCLLAQGFSPLQLATCFFGLGLVPGCLGAFLGVPAAMVFAWKVACTSASITGFPEPHVAWEPTWLLLAGGSAVLVGLLSTLPPTLGVLRLRPSNALRGASDLCFAGLPAPLERRLQGSAPVRYAVRNVFRRVRLSLATAVLVALAVALPSGLRTSLASWETWATKQALELRWDAIASFKVPVPIEHVRDMMADKGIAAWDGYVQGYATVRREDGVTEEMRVRGLPARSDVVHLSLTSGRQLADDQADEAIMNTAFANARPPRIGEHIVVLRHGVIHRLVVVGLVTDAALSTVVVPRGTAQRLFGLEEKLSGAYVRFGTASSPGRASSSSSFTKPPATSGSYEAVEAIDLGETTAPAVPTSAPSVSVVPTATAPKAALLDDELVTNVEVRSEYARATLEYLSAFNVIIVPFVGLSGVLAFFFLLSVLGFLLLERETEYATLRSMGYAKPEIARIVFTEVGVLAALGLAISLGTWAATAYALQTPMATAWFSIELDFRAQDFALAALPTLAFLMLAALPGIRALVRMDLAAALRGRALG
jgi:putative ABC transport system permease protein